MNVLGMKLTENYWYYSGTHSTISPNPYKHSHTSIREVVYEARPIMTIKVKPTKHKDRK